MRITSLSDIQQAQKVIHSLVHKTSVDYSRSFSHLSGTEVFLKKENEQRTGSFKIRGASYKMHCLKPEEKAKGVVACSAGNHAQGVALSARLANVKSVIVMPETAPLVKVEATRDYGAEIILKGQIYDEAAEHAHLLSQQFGYTFFHPFEDPDVIAGQGTLGLEVLEQIENLDSIVVPIGGGGLISGIAIAVKALKPKCKIYGVQATRVSSMATAFLNKKLPTEVTVLPTIADGIAVKRPSQYMYDNYISKYVDDVVTVSEDEIAEAIVHLMERSKAVVEGAGASSMAAVLNRKLPLGKNTCVVLSGGNIDMNLVEKVIDRGLSRHGRITRLSVIVGDVPGTLNRLTGCFANLRANVLQVSHDRIDQGVALMETRIDFTLETNSLEHIETIKKTLVGMGVRLLEK
ncbi:MAG: threonine ammonia-lyase [Bdellovibrionales bacterium]